MSKRNPLYNADKYVKCHGHYGKQYVEASKNLKNIYIKQLYFWVYLKDLKSVSLGHLPVSVSRACNQDINR